MSLATPRTRRSFIQATATAGALASIGTPLFAQSATLAFKWANNIPVTHPSTIRIREAADAIRRDSNGRVDIQIFPNNQLGGDTDMLSLPLRLIGISVEAVIGLLRALLFLPARLLGARPGKG